MLQQHTAGSKKKKRKKKKTNQPNNKLTQQIGQSRVVSKEKVVVKAILLLDVPLKYSQLHHFQKLEVLDSLMMLANNACHCASLSSNVCAVLV